MHSLTVTTCLASGLVPIHQSTQRPPCRDPDRWPPLPDPEAYPEHTFAYRRGNLCCRKNRLAHCRPPDTTTKNPTFHVPEIEPFVAGSKPRPNYAQIPCEAADIKADEDSDVEKIKGPLPAGKRSSIASNCSDISWKKDWTFEPFENFFEGAHAKLLDLHCKHPQTPRDNRLLAA